MISSEWTNWRIWGNGWQNKNKTERVVKEQERLRVTKDAKLWRAMITDVLNREMNHRTYIRWSLSNRFSDRSISWFNLIMSFLNESPDISQCCGRSISKVSGKFPARQHRLENLWHFNVYFIWNYLRTIQNKKVFVRIKYLFLNESRMRNSDLWLYLPPPSFFCFLFFFSEESLPVTFDSTDVCYGIQETKRTSWYWSRPYLKSVVWTSSSYLTILPVLNVSWPHQFVILQYLSKPKCHFAKHLILLASSTH